MDENISWKLYELFVGETFVTENVNFKGSHFCKSQIVVNKRKFFFLLFFHLKTKKIMIFGK